MLGLYPLQEWINWLLLMMERYNITYIEASKASGIGIASISRILNGIEVPGYNTLKKLCDGVSDIVRERKGEI